MRDQLPPSTAVAHQARGVIDPRAYRQHSNLTPAERVALAQLNERFQAGLKPWPQPACAALTPLLQPLYDVLRVTGACTVARNSAVHLLVEEMHQRQTAFWAWGDAEWLDVLCPSEREFRLRHRWSGNCRQYVLAMAYLLGGFTRLEAIGTYFQYRLAIKVFGREPVDTAVRRVREELQRIGYGSRATGYVPTALCEALLLNRSPRLEALTVEVLEAVRHGGSLYIQRGIGTVSHSLVRLGILARPLSFHIETNPAVTRYQATAAP